MDGAEHTDDSGFHATAEAQAAAISNRQLKAHGLTAKEVKGLLRRHILRPTPARSVYRVAGAERSWKQDLWIALLAGPEGTLASHLSAAALAGLLAPPAVPHVTVPRWANGKFGGAVVHHGQVGPADRRCYEGVAATTVARTIVDCGAILQQSGLNSLVDAAIGKGLCSYQGVMDAWERAGRVEGGSLLRAALEPYSAGAEPGSVKAAHVLRRIREWGLPMPMCEKEIRDKHGGFIARVDFIWEPWWLILEYDGDEFHGPRRWRIDDDTQAALEGLGLRVERADRFDLRPSSTRLYDLLSSILLQLPTGPWPARVPPKRRAA